MLLKRISVLDDKLGPVVFQLPPSIGGDVNRLNIFLAALPDEYLKLKQIIVNTG
jgi:uncharacterized protein YecE (DUF72 family)